MNERTHGEKQKEKEDTNRHAAASGQDGVTEGKGNVLHLDAIRRVVGFDDQRCCGHKLQKNDITSDGFSWLIKILQ